jgi:cell division protein FtsB
VAGASLTLRTRRTTRLVILGLIALALIISLAPTLRVYLRQHDQIASLREQAKTEKAQVAQLQQQQDEWNDPAYVEAQARSRLQFVKPGQLSFVVVAPKAAQAAAPASGVVAGAVGTAGRSWVDGLWTSVQKAGLAPAGSTR